METTREVGRGHSRPCPLSGLQIGPGDNTEGTRWEYEGGK